MEYLKENEPEDEFSYFNFRICVIGLGYVGLSLAKLFSAKYKTIGFDLDQAHVDELMGGCDSFTCTADIEKIRHCNFYVIAAPVPADRENRSNLQPLWIACEVVGKVISGGDIVVYESTVCPGVTEEECIPLIEKLSGLSYNSHFFAGYSPVQANPDIRKVTSGSTPEIAKIVNEAYASIITAGTLLAASIREAEAAGA